MEPDNSVPCTYDPTLDALYSYLVTEDIFDAEYDRSITTTVALTANIDIDRQGNIIGIEFPQLREELNGVS